MQIGVSAYSYTCTHYCKCGITCVNYLVSLATCKHPTPHNCHQVRSTIEHSHSQNWFHLKIRIIDREQSFMIMERLLDRYNIQFADNTGFFVKNSLWMLNRWLFVRNQRAFLYVRDSDCGQFWHIIMHMNCFILLKE